MQSHHSEDPYVVRELEYTKFEPVPSTQHRVPPSAMSTSVLGATRSSTMTDETDANNISPSSKLSSLRAMFDKNPPKIKKPQQYQHGRGHALNNLASGEQEPLNPLGKNVNPNSSANDLFRSAEYSPVKKSPLPGSPNKEMKTWNPKGRRDTDRPLFAHDQRPLNPFGKDVNPNANATELLEERVKASKEFEEKLGKLDLDSSTGGIAEKDSDSNQETHDGSDNVSEKEASAVE